MRGKLKLVTALAACVALAGGCGRNDKEDGDGKSSSAPGSAPRLISKPAAGQEPEAVVLALAKALNNGDAKAALKHVATSADDEAFVKTGITLAAKTTAFYNAGVEAYGQKDWAAALGAAKLRMSPALPPAERIAKTLKIDVAGNRARVVYEGQKRPMTLVRKDGVWMLLPLAQMMPGKEDRGRIIRIASAMVPALERASGRIGRPGVSAGGVIEVLFEAMGAAGKGKPASAPRSAPARGATRPAVEPAAPKAPPGSTPKAAVLAMARAMEAGDGAAFAEHFDAAGADKAILSELAAAMGKLAAFEKAGIEAYGKQAWLKAGGGRGVALPGADEIAEKLKISRDGDTAVCTLGEDREPLKLVRKSGRWLIKAEHGGLLPPADRRGEALKMMKTLADAVDGPMKKIGRSGVTAEQVLAEFRSAITSAMKEMVPKRAGGASRPAAH